MSEQQQIQELEVLLEEQNGILTMLDELIEADPNDQDSKQSKAETLSDINSTKAQIAGLKKALKASAAPPAPSAENTLSPPPPAHDDVPPPKFDMSKHPKFSKASAETPPPPPSDDSPKVFNVRDLVMAKYSGDHQYYKATIISKTGSSTDPVYTVNFTEYNTIETKRKFEIRAIENKKRKAEGAPEVSAPPTPFSPKPAATGSVISAAPSVDPTLVQKREPSKVSDGPTRMAPEPKKLKGSKALDKTQASWNSWQQNGPKKSSAAVPGAKKKDSQFRTPDLPNAKVGFTGSGKPMQKDQSKGRWKYGGADEPIG